MALQIKVNQLNGSLNGEGKQPINLSTRGTIMRECFMVNNKPPCFRKWILRGGTYRKTSPGLPDFVDRYRVAYMLTFLIDERFNISVS